MIEIFQGYEYATMGAMTNETLTGCHQDNLKRFQLDFLALMTI